MKAIALFTPQADNGISGYVLFHQPEPRSPVKMFFDLKGFQSNSTHAIHIHEYGDLSDGCKSLGAHFNPTGTRHFHSGGGHAGDLFNNFITDRSGKFVYEYVTDRISLFPGLSSVLGRSVVIHKFPDDLGLEGVLAEDGLYLYTDMTTEQLRRLSKTLGYPQFSREEMVQRLRQESRTTGNASTRISGAIIALTKS
jgi:Cu-Zn family superoxide dismutase